MDNVGRRLSPGLFVHGTIADSCDQALKGAHASKDNHHFLADWVVGRTVVSFMSLGLFVGNSHFQIRCCSQILWLLSMSYSL